jgi:hypothetical protein
MTGIDTSPLVPLANLAITTFAGVATVAIPLIGYYAIQWLRSHIAQAKQQTANAAASQIDSVIQKGIAYAAQKGLDPVQGARDYAIVQAPALLKNLDFDTTTDAGKASVTRMVEARLVPTPVAPVAVDVAVAAAPTIAAKYKETRDA